MASVAELRKKIRGIRTTRQITNAMKMIAAARYGHAQRAASDAVRFPAESRGILDRLAAAAASGAERYAPAAGRESCACVILVAGDKGLCGDFNSSALRLCRDMLAAPGVSVTRLMAIGRKACDFGRTCGLPTAAVLPYPQAFAPLSLDFAERVAHEALRGYLAGDYGRVVALSHELRGGVRRRVGASELLPLGRPPAGSAEVCVDPPDPAAALDSAVGLWLAGRIHELLRQSLAAELSARMLAMDNATRNADDLIDRVTLSMNKTRQAAITRELAELAGSEQVVG